MTKEDEEFVKMMGVSWDALKPKAIRSYGCSTLNMIDEMMNWLDSIGAFKIEFEKSVAKNRLLCIAEMSSMEGRTYWDSLKEVAQNQIGGGLLEPEISERHRKLGLNKI